MTRDVRPPAHRRLYAASLVSMAVFAASIVTPAICLREIGDEFGLSLAQRGLLGGLRMGSLLAALLLSGCLADRLGKRRFLTGGMLVIAVGLASTAAAQSYSALLAAQVIVGLGAGALEALVNPLVAELHAESPARPLNVANGFFSVGLVIGALLAGEILQAGHTWRVVPWIWVAPAVLGALLFAARPYPSSVPDGGQSSTRQAFIAKPLFWVLAVAIALAGGCEAGMTFWGASFTESEFGASARAGAQTTAFFGAFMAVGRFAAGGLVSRIRPMPMMAFSAAACALGTAGLCFVQGLHGAWALFALGGLFVACFWPTILAVASQHVQRGSATMFACLAAAGIGGCGVFPWGIGALGDVGGLRLGAALLPVSMVAELAVLIIAWRMLSRRGPARSQEP